MKEATNSAEISAAQKAGRVRSHTAYTITLKGLETASSALAATNVSVG
jgi:hypothetical protein